MSKIVANTAWVADDGSFGAGEIVLFDPNALTDLEWEIVAEETSDMDRLDVVKQILNSKKADETNE
jgi:hypothetical protein